MVTRHDDLSLQYVLSGPADTSQRPLVVIMHGRGADMSDLADIAPMIDRGGYRFVFPNAPHPFEPYPGTTFGRTWFDGWPPTRQSLDESRARLLRFLDEIVERYPRPDASCCSVASRREVSCRSTPDSARSRSWPASCQ